MCVTYEQYARYVIGNWKDCYGKVMNTIEV
ncbi:hypothetical protein F383_37931 [Gossypium arboreum]|uniref:Uncharacterized protein n=1 Tax=Gossypium arboreum TaxID=29729 RepID=A0A0B0MCY9_GOSAR|nr:hypothetical protein F383_37931 [Gossypium arboreum]